MSGSISKNKVYVTSVNLRGNPVLSAGRELLKKYGLENFEIAREQTEAEIILYLENGYLGLAELPRLLKRVRAVPAAKHFLFSESDWPFPVLPGAYPSLSRPHPWAHSWSFLPTDSANTQDGWNSTNNVEPEFLFSFLGRITTHPIRKKVQQLDNENTPCLDIEDGARRFRPFDYWRTYADLIKRSKFVLCPRGFGTSSIRIFEAMSLGRAPVVISDQWQPPPGIPWSEFCVPILESDISSIPVMLDRLEGKAISMGQRARQIYSDHFAPNIFLDRLLTTIVSRYSEYSFETEIILLRAWRALGWRELHTLCHQVRSFALSSSPVRQKK